MASGERPIGQVMQDGAFKSFRLSHDIELFIAHYDGDKAVASYDGQGAFRQTRTALESGVFAHDTEARVFVHRWLELSGHQSSRYPLYRREQ